MKRFFILLNIVLLAVACKNAPKESAVDYSKFGGSLGNVEMIVENEYVAVFNGEDYQVGQLLGTTYDFYDEDGKPIKHQYANPDGNISSTITYQYENDLLYRETNNSYLTGYDEVLTEKKKDGTLIYTINYSKEMTAPRFLHIAKKGDTSTNSIFSINKTLERKSLEKQNECGQIAELIDSTFYGGKGNQLQHIKYVYDKHLLMREDAINDIYGHNILYKYTEFDETGNWTKRIVMRDKPVGYQGNINVQNTIDIRSYTYRKASTEGK